jgi:hypothetical protein
VRLRSKVALAAVVAVAGVAAMLLVQSCRYRRYKETCESIEPGVRLADAARILEGAGGKKVAQIGKVHQWLRVRFSLKHQSCLVTVDEGERVLSTRHEDSWDLL